MRPSLLRWPRSAARPAPARRRCPTSANALQQRKQIKISAIGASSTAVIGWRREGGPPLLEQILERTINGVDVEIINRGFSGELAEAAGKRIEIEVALNHPDIVLWQVGTNDAFAQVPVESFQPSVSNTVRWLKAHNVDVILVGLHYMKQLGQQSALPGDPRQSQSPRRHRERAAHPPLRGDGDPVAHDARGGRPTRRTSACRRRLQLHGPVRGARHRRRPLRKPRAGPCRAPPPHPLIG